MLCVILFPLLFQHKILHTAGFPLHGADHFIELFPCSEQIRLIFLPIIANFYILVSILSAFRHQGSVCPLYSYDNFHAK